jgi:hypothetical protein
MVAVISAVWLGGVTAVIFTLVRLYYALLRGPADVSVAMRGATISSPLYWTAVVLAFVAAFALGKYWARGAMSLSLGLALFVALGFLYMLVGVVRGPVETAHATGISAIFGATIWNPLFYLAFMGCLLVGVAVVRSWPTPVR